MSVLPEQHRIPSPEAVPAEDEALVFAAASIVKEMAAGATHRPVREVVIGDQSFRLEGRRLHVATDSTGPIVLVHVHSLQPELPPADVLRSRFGLTKKEACVALLIAEDRTNDQIAAHLSISPHTARHHTERVLAKLDVRSRTKVRNALVK
jgi:DNA-binding CsgD family transcriptional regulator